MSDFKGYRQQSRRDWGSSDEQMTLEQVKVGAILRIADATEQMAKRHTELINERDRYERWYLEEKAAVRKLDRRVNALRGVITKLKAKAVKP